MADDGLYPKYTVQKHHDPGHKHDECMFFVLDLTHDKAARAAALYYAAWVGPDNPKLARELRDAVREAEQATPTPD